MSMTDEELLQAGEDALNSSHRAYLVPERKFGILQKPPLALRIKVIAQA